jgi:GNAT superfamily N-acetyltransferase
MDLFDMNTTTTPALNALTVMAETVEAEFMYAYESGAPSAVRVALGMATARIGGGVVLAMAEDPVEYWNKALGLGVSEPVTARLLDEVFGFYRAHGVQRAAIQIAPSLLPPDWRSLRQAHGLSAGPALVKLGADVDGLDPQAATDLRVEPVWPGDAAQWAEVIVRGNGAPDARIAGMIAAGATQPGFQPFAAWAGEELVAGANLLVRGLVGSLNSAATVPEHRGRGAQSALIAARIEAARRAGCRWVTAEAALPAAGAVNPSLTNLERAGLRGLYIRRDWIWHADQVPFTGLVCLQS